ncbi:lysylphosphatidylglycerol synthase transmembrane domain-containing protein [Marinobacterium lutimaris]|uniref:Lysylphosphatidylglycerol synthase TM region n=1 Tax=Marinobacterium lutimaris TaxID=568106 RepID=A0A1H6C5N4_9GAMM|nr:lysylphosphatidylglycerol synthase transmembrane domain-containing protein [Marinobacterium lutimaris]SEG68271.1 hypothetical protein SAMN05444390_103207 [Marinobacterium lutimaris]
MFILLSAAVPWAILSDLQLDRPLLDDRLLKPGFIAACLGLLLVYFASDGLRLYYTLRALGYRIPAAAQTRLVFINILISNVTPMATGGGLAQIWYLRHQGVHVGAATAATTLRTLLAVCFIFLPTPFLLMFLEPLRNSALGEQLAVYLALFAFIYVGAFALLIFKMRWMLKLADGLIALLHRIKLISAEKKPRLHFALRREMLRFRAALKAFMRGNLRYRLLALFFTGLFLLSLFSFPALLLWGLEYEVNYLLTLGLLVVTTFVMYFAPTPGAAGVAEAVFGLFFSAMLQSGDLVLTILLWRFLTIHLGMLIGLPVTLHSLFKGALSRA